MPLEKHIYYSTNDSNSSENYAGIILKMTLTRKKRSLQTFKVIGT